MVKNAATKAIIKGLATLVPGIYPTVQRIKGKSTGKERSPHFFAQYSYSVWLRHLVLAFENGLMTRHPPVVAELGPGDTLGVGLAALLTGAERYDAIDLVRYVTPKENLVILDKLVTLFSRRTDIPEERFTKIYPKLDSYRFPHQILDDDLLNHNLDPERIARLRREIASLSGDDTCANSCIRYSAPWHDPNIIQADSVDMLISQAVLEHVDDLPCAHEMMYRWLKPGGFTSHTIDYGSHDLANEWNGHWTYSNRIWKLIRGRRPYLINRAMHSQHIELIKESGFDIVAVRTKKLPSAIESERFAPCFRNAKRTDYTTAGAFIQALKPVSQLGQDQG